MPSIDTERDNFIVIPHPLNEIRKYGKLGFHNMTTLTLILASELVNLGWEDMSMNLWSRLNASFSLASWVLLTMQTAITIHIRQSELS